MPTPVCTDELRKIYDAIVALGSGRQAVSVSFGERSATYAQAQLPALQRLYGMFYRSCGADSGLPDLSLNNAVERGPPALYRGGI